MNLTKRLYVDNDVNTPITAQNLNDIQSCLIENTCYGVCGTAAATKAKTVTVSAGFVLQVGAAVKVKFTNANTADAPTLDVNQTGAKEIRKSAGRAVRCYYNDYISSWSAGEVLEFVYDGQYWMINSPYRDFEYVYRALGANTDTVDDKILYSKGSVTLDPGLWVVQLTAVWGANANGYRQIALSPTDSQSMMDSMRGLKSLPVSGTASMQQLTTVMKVDSTKTYYFNVYQNSGSTITCDARFTGLRINRF